MYIFTLPRNVARNLLFSKVYAVVEALLSFPAAAAGVACFLAFGPGFASVEGLASGLALALANGFTFVGFCDATRSLCRWQFTGLFYAHHPGMHHAGLLVGHCWTS